MRFLVGLMCVLAGLVASPLSASAQAGEDDTTSEPSAEEPAPSTEPTPEEAALQLELDDVGVGVTPSPLRTPDGYTIEELERRVKRAELGLIAPAAVIIAGLPPLVLGRRGDNCQDFEYDSDHCRRLRTAGLVLTISGSVGMIIGSVVVGVRERRLSSAQRDYTGEQPPLQLELDDTGVEVAPSPPRTPDGYTLEEMELRVKRARRGLIGTSVILGLGVVLSVGAAVCAKRNPPSGEQLIEVSSCFGLDVGALVLIGVGSIGMIVSGPVLGARKRKLRGLQGGHYGSPRRLQWDLARSRLVF